MKRLTYLFVCSLAIGSIVACKQESKFQIINGIVYDATMNNITLITGKGDTVNISTMDANRDKVCGVLLEDSVEVVCIKEKMEGKEILKGDVDVIVTDGFTGNATLKAIEGTASVILRLLKESLLNNGLRPKVGALLAKPGLTALKKRFDTARYGGAVLLGVNAPVVKTHGRSNIRPIYYTLLQIDKMLSQDLVGEYKKYFSESR